MYIRYLKFEPFSFISQLTVDRNSFGFSFVLKIFESLTPHYGLPKQCNNVSEEDFGEYEEKTIMTNGMEIHQNLNKFVLPCSFRLFV